MGTNYYLVRDACPHCGRSDDRMHIGKSSCGWCFGLHVYEDGEGPENLDEWRAAWSEPGAAIQDEGGEKITPEEMYEIITKRAGGDSKLVPMGYGSLAEALEKNHATAGPRGLWRHKIGLGCIGHGDGTWDLLTGDFS